MSQPDSAATIWVRYVSQFHRKIQPSTRKKDSKSLSAFSGDLFLEKIYIFLFTWVAKGTLLYHLCFKCFSQYWFRNVCIFVSCFERWWCIKTGQASTLEIILLKIEVRSLVLKNYLSLGKANFNHFNKSNYRTCGIITHSWL